MNRVLRKAHKPLASGRLIWLAAGQRFGSVTTFISKTGGNVKLRILISFAISLLFTTVSVVAITTHDNTRLYQPWEKSFFVLSAGGAYNKKTPKNRAMKTRGRPPPPTTRPPGTL